MNTYPVNLLLANRKCLLVGGGKVASRKLDQLIKTGAIISVVASKSSSKIKKLAQSGKLQLFERSFKESDLDNVFLLYIATEDKELNQRISKFAKKRGILNCSVDKNWTKGSFITPASVNHKEITLAVSSQGLDCRKSRLIKENLARHIDYLENSKLLVLGTDHNLMSMEKLEQIQLNGSKLNKAGNMIKTLWGIQEFALLNTCNRIELIAIASPSEQLFEMLKMILKLDKKSYYLKTGYEAFSHLSFVGAGLLSQTLGENHISSQFKQAFMQARKEKWTGVLLESLKDSVLHVSRQIRNETREIFKGFDIEELVFEHLKGKLTNKKIVIIGTGVVGSSIIKLLACKKGKIDWLYFSKKPDNKDKNVFVNKLSCLSEKLKEADIIISAVSVDKAIISIDMADCFKSGAEVIDIGMPRNVSPELESIRKDVKFSNMEDIKHSCHKQDKNIKALFSKVDNLIEKHKDEYEKFSNSFIDRH